MEYVIKGVNKGLDGNNHEFVKSFRCQSSNGGYCNIDALITDSFPEIDDMTQDEQVEWAEEQVGKILVVERLKAADYIACGAVSITGKPL